MELPCVSGMAARLAQRFATGERKVSAHYSVDSGDVVCSVRETAVAWHCPKANRRGIGIEHAGYSGGPLATDWLHDEHALSMLEVSAELVAGICARWPIPVVHLTPAQLLAGEHGIIGHVDATNAFKTPGGHTDPGAWPWTEYLDKIQARLET
jgi:Negative regulator of beta-lactamase expression